MRKTMWGMAIAAAIGLVIVGYAGCAHVGNVTRKCEGAVTQQLLTDVGGALAEQDYEVAIVKATVGVAPCLVIATVQEIADSLSQTTKASGIDVVIVQRHAREYLATHRAP